MSEIVHNVNNISLTPNYVQLHLEILQTPMDVIFIDLIGSLQTSTKGNQYALNVICVLTNYVKCILIPDRSTETVIYTYHKKYTVGLEEAERFCQIMEVNSNTHYFQKWLLSKESSTYFHPHTGPKSMDV